jgi:hypothetical protein
MGMSLSATTRDENSSRWRAEYASKLAATTTRSPPSRTSIATDIHRPRDPYLRTSGRMQPRAVCEASCRCSCGFSRPVRFGPERLGALLATIEPRAVCEASRRCCCGFSRRCRAATMRSGSFRIGGAALVSKVCASSATLSHRASYAVNQSETVSAVRDRGPGSGAPLRAPRAAPRAWPGTRRTPPPARGCGRWPARGR